MPAMLLRCVVLLKCLRTPEDYERWAIRWMLLFFGHYNAALKACNVIVCHDFINCAVRLLRDHS